MLYYIIYATGPSKMYIDTGTPERQKGARVVFFFFPAVVTKNINVWYYSLLPDICH